MKEFSCGLMVRIPSDHCHGPNSVPGWGTEILQAVQHSEKKKKNVKDEFWIGSEVSEADSLIWLDW